jgi:hypothetical protein
MQLLTVHSKAKVYIIGFPIQLQGCQIFLGATYKNWEKYPMAIIYTKIFHCKALQNISKSGFLV